MLLGVIAAAGLIAMAAPSAGAAGPDTQAADSYSVTEAMQPAWKTKLVALHDKQLAGTMTASDVASYDAILNTYAMGLPAGSRAGVAPLASGSNQLAGTQRSQDKNYYCGPATAMSIVVSWWLSGRRSTTNSALQPGVGVTQAALATSTYLDTDDLGQTPWNATMTRGLNLWLYGRLDAFYYHYTPSSASALTSHVETDIDAGAMVAADTYEPANIASKHYNGHPVAQTIRHWPSIYGYYNSGASIRFQDPAYQGKGMTWSASSPYFNLSNSIAWNYMTQYGATYGIVW